MNDFLQFIAGVTITILVFLATERFISRRKKP